MTEKDFMGLLIAGDEAQWALDHEQSRIGTFPLHIMRFMNCSSGAVRSAHRRLDIASGLYADFRLEYPERKWMAEVRSGAIIVRTFQSIFVLYWLNEESMLSCHYHGKTPLGTAYVLKHGCQKSDFIPTIKRCFDVRGQDCYPVDGAEMVICIEGYMHELYEILQKVRRQRTAFFTFF